MSEARSASSSGGVGLKQFQPLKHCGFFKLDVLDNVKNFSSDYEHIPSSKYFKMEHKNLVPTSQKTHFVFA